MKSKIKYMLMLVFSFLFFFSFSSFVSAEEIVEYETYILKYDYFVSINNGSDIRKYKNNTYTIDFPSDFKNFQYVTYYVNVRNMSEDTLTYPFGTYSISDSRVEETKIRFEDDLVENGITYFVIRNYNIDTIEEFVSSLIDVNFYSSMIDDLNSYLNSNLEFAYLETTGPLISGYEDIYGFNELKYTYYNHDGSLSYDSYSISNLPNLNVNDGYIVNNVSLTRLSDFYTIEDLQNKYQEGYTAGQESVDITSNDKEIYDEGYSDGYLDGFAKGESNVDITSDNDTVINLYIQENGLLTKEQGEDKYNSGYNNGKEYVYNNLDFDVTVQQYISNNYYTKNEYDLNFTAGFNKGKEYVYSNINKDPIIKEYVNTKIIETITENTNIHLVDKSSSDDFKFLVKNYDVDYSDTGDFTVNIHKGQDNYIIDTVAETNTQLDVETIIKIGIISLIVIGSLIILFVILSGFSSGTKKGKRSGYYGKKKMVF